MSEDKRTPEASPPRRTNLARIGCATIIGCFALLVAGCFAIWCESWAAIGEWSDLGGVVSVEGNLIAPKSIVLGSAPGVTTSRDADAVCDSLRRMRRLPGCVDLQMSAFGDFGFEAPEVERMLAAFQPVSLCASDIEVTDDSLRLLASNGCTETVYLDGCPITPVGLAALLDEPRIRSVRIGRNDLTDMERERLQTRYGERISIDEIWPP